MQLEIDLPNHSNNARPAITQRPRQHPKSRSKIRFCDTPKATVANYRLFGEEAFKNAQRGHQDHLCLLSSHLPSASAHSVSRPEQHLHQPNLRRTSMTEILQPNLSTSPQAPLSHSPRLRGEESLEIWRRSHGTSSLLRPGPSAIVGTTDDLKSRCRNEEFFQNLWRDRFRRQSFFDQNSTFVPVKPNFCRPKVTEEAKEIFMRGRGLTNDGMNFILNQGWSDNTGIRRVQSAVDVQRSKALTPYSSIDNVADIWNFKAPPIEAKPQAVEPYFHEGLPWKSMRDSRGVAAALDPTKNFLFDGHKIQPRVQFEGVEIAQKNRGSALFGESNESMTHPVARVRPEAKEIAKTHKGDDIKLLIASPGRLEVPQPPLRRKLSPDGYRIALLSRAQYLLLKYTKQRFMTRQIMKILHAYPPIKSKKGRQNLHRKWVVICCCLRF
ncbi:hypothetical protein ECG_06138 [Echinococcus granulosus]|uniref:Uncharacterized protein n=1 Tax=Echinococcus granulosus TaxID=6210 RepID=A0A068WMX5_ECHGR|nr:hypothetical protein ECG_06138 [Echinococcus granulosus]CDS19786.1 hypothetical protein EgrG_000513000 [Echinococcus granulosus]